MQLPNNYLFNFAVSYSGGGYKRLHEYVKAFDAIGGAIFIIHPRCKPLANEFRNNRYFFVEQPRYKRIFNDCGYLGEILTQVGKPDLYYSYGIPIYAKVAKVNWFHLSNVLPLAPQNIPLSPFDYVKMRYIGWRIKSNYVNADVISAESNFSLGLINIKEKNKLFLSVNGSDDELAILHANNSLSKANIAVVLGTYRYKAIKDSFRVFEMLRQIYVPDLKLVIIGAAEHIPPEIAAKPNVFVKGLLARSEVMACLREARFYISTTYIENSYNAASEGVFFAEESFISDIGPHRELLQNMPFKIISVPNMTRSILHVKRTGITAANIKSWENVILETINKTQIMLQYHSTPR